MKCKKLLLVLATAFLLVGCGEGATPEEETKPVDDTPVVIPKVNLKAPAGLRISGDYLFWNRVSNAVSYTMKFNEQEIKDITATSYNVAAIADTLVEDETPTDFTISLKAIGDNKYYTDSSYSEEITYTYTRGEKPVVKTELAVPSFSYDETANVVKWEAVANAVSYEVMVNSSSDTVTGLEYAINVEKGESFTFKMRAIADSASTEYKNSSWSEQKEFTRPEDGQQKTKLQTPEWDYDPAGNIIYWSEVSNAVSYVVTIDGEDNEVTDTEFSPEKEVGDTFTFSMKAVAEEGSDYTDSDVTETVTLTYQGSPTPEPTYTYQVSIKGEEYQDVEVEDSCFALSEVAMESNDTIAFQYSEDLVSSPLAISIDGDDYGFSTDENELIASEAGTYSFVITVDGTSATVAITKEDEDEGFKDNIVFLYSASTEKWAQIEMSQSETPETQYEIKDLELKEGDKFVIHMTEDIWYHFNDVKDGCASLVESDGEDQNIVIKEDGTYNIYSDTSADGNGDHIWISKQGQETGYKYDKLKLYGANGDWSVALNFVRNPLNAKRHEALSVYISTSVEFKVVGTKAGKDDVWMGYNSVSNKQNQNLKEGANDNNIAVTKAGYYDITYMEDDDSLYIGESSKESAKYYVATSASSIAWEATYGTAMTINPSNSDEYMCSMDVVEGQEIKITDRYYWFGNWKTTAGATNAFALGNATVTTDGNAKFTKSGTVNIYFNTGTSDPGIYIEFQA